jgi:hypothetical protein
MKTRNWLILLAILFSRSLADILLGRTGMSRMVPASAQYRIIEAVKSVPAGTRFFS